MYSYGYDVNATGANQLANRPAMIDQPFGAGHALLLGTDPFYRAWTDGQERLVLNGVLYPIGARRSRRAHARPQAPAARAAGDAADRGEQAAGGPSRPDTGGRDANRDLQIKVRRSERPALKAAVKAAHLSKRLQKLVHYSTTKLSVTLDDEERAHERHARPRAVGRPHHGRPDQRHVKALAAQI